jgi:hypothetical protein
VTEPQTAPVLLPLGDAGVACEGDACEIPGQHEQQVMNRRIDEDLI